MFAPASPGRAPPDSLENIFHATQLELLVPDASFLGRAGPSSRRAPSTEADGGSGRAIEEDEEWVRGVLAGRARDVAFFDERLTYFLALHVPFAALAPAGRQESGEKPPVELLRYLARLQLTLNASFLPPLPDAIPSNGPVPPQTPTTASLLPPPPQTPISHSGPSLADPATPLPFPAMRDAEENYAQVEGVTVWEGEVARLPPEVLIPPSGISSSPSTSTALAHAHADGGAVESASGLNSEAKPDDPDRGRVRHITRGADGWDVLYEGQAPVAYVRTPIARPVLGLTASITLRDKPPARRTHRSMFSVDTISSVDTGGRGGDGAEDRQGEGEKGDAWAGAGVGGVDLLGGLAGAGLGMPATRLGPSIIHDLSLPPADPLSALPLSAFTPLAGPSYPSPASTSHSSQTSISLPHRDQGSLPSSLAPVAPLGVTLRKSYRRIMALSPGLRVRMRSLVLPQLEPLDQTARRERLAGRPGMGRGHGQGHGSEAADEGEGEGEKRVVLCVEIENPPDDLEHAWRVTGVGVEIGGKGGKATAELSCDPAAKDEVPLPRSPITPTTSTFSFARGGPGVGAQGEGSGRATAPFPIELEPVEQYNLLYSVNIATGLDPLDGGLAGAGGSAAGMANDPLAQSVLRSLGAGEMQRPVAITVKAYPVARTSAKGNRTGNEVQPTTEFSSRWNCSLDLAAYFASPNAGVLGHRPGSSISAGPARTLASRPQSVMPTQNQIAGDRRYSLASLLQGDKGPSAGPGHGRAGSIVPLPRAVSGISHRDSRVLSGSYPYGAGAGAGEGNPAALVLSARVLPRADAPPSGAGVALRPLDEFTVEVFVQNVSEEVRRFRLVVPPTPGPWGVGAGGGLRGVDGGVTRPGKGVEGSLRHRLAAASSTAAPTGGAGSGAVDSPALVPLENDVRCGPLIPGASLAARMRFVALRAGVHRLERLRVVGTGTNTGGLGEVDHVISPVLDVVVAPPIGVA